MCSLVARAMQNSERLGLYVWVHEVSEADALYCEGKPEQTEGLDVVRLCEIAFT